MAWAARVGRQILAAVIFKHLNGLQLTDISASMYGDRARCSVHNADSGFVVFGRNERSADVYSFLELARFDRSRRWCVANV